MEEDFTVSLQLNASERRIYHAKTTYAIPKTLFDQFKSDMGSSWWNPQDEILCITYYENEDVMHMEKRRSLFNWKLKQSSLEPYEILDSQIDPEQKAEIVKNLKELFDMCRYEHLIKMKEEVSTRLKESFSGISFALKSLRGKLLSETDWTQMPDCPIDETKKNVYKKFRQELRDITITPEWLSGQMMLVEFPIPPEEYWKLDPNGEVEYLSIPEHYYSEAAARLKAKLLKFAGYLGMTSEEWGIDFEKIMTDMDTDLAISKLRSNIDYILQKIDPNLEIVIRNELDSDCPDCDV